MAAVLERKPRAKNSRNSKVLLQPNGRTTRIARPKTTAPAAKEKLLTAEEYWGTCSSDHSELINGKVVEHVPPGGQHGLLAGRIYRFLIAFVIKKKLGEALIESGYRLTSGDVRSPDVSYIAYKNLPNGKVPVAYFESAPDLAVEVISPGENWSDVEEKVQLYLQCNTKMVWIVDPKTETVTVREAEKTRVYDKASTLSGDPVLPGFKLPLEEIFDI